MLLSLTKSQLESIFKDLAKQLKSKLRGNNFSYELIIVGGASILLNYSFRMSTIDIDCLDVNDALMNEVVNEVGEKHNLPNGWINTDFIKTNSYTPKLIQYSSFYKSYSNGTLVIRTIKDEYLVAMKMVAARNYQHDISDIYGIIIENKRITFEAIEKAIIDLYGSLKIVENRVIEFVKDIFINPSIRYIDIKNEEDKNKEVLIEKIQTKCKTKPGS